MACVASIAAVVLWISATAVMILATAWKKLAILVPIGGTAPLDMAPKNESGMMFMISPAASVTLAPVRIWRADVVRSRFWFSLLIRPAWYRFA